jgi:pyruvate ferredoxin oxidoreductase delta subunit
MSNLPRASELPIGAVIPEPGSTRRNKTAGWRTLKPVIHDDRCVRCQLCWLYCPEGTIVEIKGVFKVNGRTYDTEYEINYDYCKGCGICANECPTKAIEMVPEAP